MPKRVLIVDDEENIREMTRLALEAVGYEVGEAGSGLEAFAVIGVDERWDAVLLDQKMPGMVGTEVLRRLKVMLPTAPVIMMTAYASVDLAVEAMKLGATDFVRKPMTPEILRNALKAALAKVPEHHPSNDSDRTPSAQVTLNGFSILRATDIPGLAPQGPNERCFMVRRPDGRKQQVVVEIHPDAISAVEKMTNDLPLGKAFWTEQAEQFLRDFLWNDGNAPAAGRMTLRGVEQEALAEGRAKGNCQMSKRILTIDDEENIRRVTRLTLQAAGYEVGEAADGEHGLEAFGDGSSWDAVLLDQRMPGMDGLETLRQINQRDPTARVIIATAYASIELAVDAMKLGATDFVRKPMTPEILRNAVAAALAKQPRVSEASATPLKESPAEPLIQIITMNGFTILDSEDARHEPNERRFIVKSPTGSEHEVLVQIDDEAVGYVKRMTRRQLPPENSFWTSQAQRLLGDYLWREGKVPPTRKLTIKGVDRDELPIAARWQTT